MTSPTQRRREPLDDDALEARARSLYPGDAYLQQQWMRAMRLVQTTAHGWVLDAPVVRIAQARHS